ncbi:MAG: N4-gp56 family major capsid protein [Candidatus Peribacteria bacterium]|jgi:N4-gp56 family major capsid protein|nr:N4-gp56 family major capsid protein [Candidatus Peribacteria bacterium]
MPFTGTSTANITASGSQPVLQNYLHNYFLKNYTTKNRFRQLGKAPISSVGYKTISRARMDRDLSTEADAVLTEGVPPSDTILPARLVTVTPIQYGKVSTISDVLIAMSKLDIVKETLANLADNAHRIIDSVIQNELLANMVNVRYAGGVASRAALTSNSVINIVDISVLRTFLSQKGAPTYDADKYLAIIDDNVAHDLRMATGTNTWVDVHKYTSFGIKNIYTGEIGSLHGVRFLTSNNLKTVDIVNTQEATVTVHMCYFMGKEAYGVASLQAFKTYYVPNNSSFSNPLAQGARVGWKCDFASVILNQEGIARLECASSSNVKFGTGVL